MSVEKDRKTLTELATRYGFAFDAITSRMHYKWRHPTGKVVFTVSKLEGSIAHRELKNSERKFRAALSSNG